MAMEIVIRVNADKKNGLGHFNRVLNLSNELIKLNYKVTIFIDKLSIFDVNKVISKMLFIKEIYKDNKYKDENSDAIIFVSLLKIKPDLVIVDDYRFSINWEIYVKNNLNCPILVFDDLARKHSCEIIIDSKWEGLQTGKRYDGLVPSYCIKMLGPYYKILNITKKEKEKKCDQFNILISIGGGGDLKIILPIILAINELIKHGFKIFTVIVAGPLSENIELITKNKKLINKNFKILYAPNNLSEFIANSDLFFGASGTVLYESISMGVPALSFELSSNQSNDIYALEDFGHYFNLGNISQSNQLQIKSLLSVIINNYERILDLTKNKKIKLNFNSSKKIAELIKNFLLGIDFQIHKCNQLSQMSNDVLNEILVKVNDTHINRYLDARNNIINTKNMMLTENISRLNHYIWWFKNKRESYFYSRRNINLLYIWHEKIKISVDEFMIGGWFVVDENCTFLDAMYATKLQLAMTDKNYPNVKWLAVIKKDNNFVNRMNLRLGFNLIDSTSSYFYKVKSAFPKVDENLFNFYIR